MPKVSLKKVDLVSEVVDRLRSSIVEGNLREGDEIRPEADLCERFGVSRTVIREAMRILQAHGLVELAQGRRHRVRAIDPEVPAQSMSIYLERMRAELKYLIEVRLRLECDIAALAAERIDERTLAELEDSIEALCAAKKLDERVNADMRFHEILGKATGNPIFLTLMQAIWGLLRQSRYFTIPRSGVAVTAEGHRQILEALRHRDSSGARQAMKDHLDQAASIIKDYNECLMKR